MHKQQIDGLIMNQSNQINKNKKANSKIIYFVVVIILLVAISTAVFYFLKK